jgi:SAM-dependent methyltransferase
VCGADDAAPLHLGQDRLLKRGGRFPIVRCRRCGMVYQNPQPDDLAALYDDAYLPVHEDEGEWRPFLDRFRRVKPARVGGRSGLYYAALKQAVPHSEGRLLDIGCGTGNFIKAMRRLGYQVDGVEISPEAAAIANAQLTEGDHAPVVCGVLEDAQYPDASFDVVTLWHVIEHLPDPAKTLREIRRVLKPNGRCVIQTPKLDSPEAKLFGKYWAGLDSPRHLWIFTDSTLERLAKDAGLSVERRINGVSYGIFKLSLKFWFESEAVHRPNWANKLDRPNIDRLLFYATVPIDKLGLGSQLTFSLVQS